MVSQSDSQTTPCVGHCVIVTSLLQLFSGAVTVPEHSGLFKSLRLLGRAKRRHFAVLSFVVVFFNL